MPSEPGTAVPPQRGSAVDAALPSPQTKGRRVIPVALAVTFLAMALFAVLTALQSSTLTHAVSRSVRQSDLYQKARYWVGTEESLERKYRLEPGPDILAQHAKAGRTVLMVIRAAVTNSSPDERQGLDRLVSLHGQYVNAVHSALFPAVRTHDAVHVNNIDRIMVDPVFTQLETQLDAAARTHRVASRAQLARLIRLQDTLALLAPLVFLAGMGILVLLWRLMQRHQQRLDYATETTMNRLRAEAITDPLTALGNHRSFQEGLGAAIRLGALDGTALTLARLDLDEFKSINDRGGHLHGDSVLSDVGHLLGMGFPGRSYRVGGDEFALLLPLPSDQARAALDDLRTSLAAGHLPTISVGLTTTTSGTISPDDLHQQADQALRAAKRRGRNRVVTFKEIEDRASLLGQGQVDALRDLLSCGALDVEFQPIWGLGGQGHASEAPMAFEALARPSADSGFRGPQELFDVAARVHRGAELDRQCLHTILARTAELPQGSLLFLNLSPQTLDQETPLAEQLLRDVKAAGLPPQRVVIEITERSTGNLPAVLQQAAALRAAGFRLALDDVGAGNAGLEMLRCMPVDFVKIDRSIVVAAPMDTTSNAVLAAIMAYARESGVTVIVEGIESVASLRHAWRLGARCAQGYLLGRPTPGFGTSFPVELNLPGAPAPAEGVGMAHRGQS
ncbi:EAL domain-containing protein [Deinococcus sp. KSM4-11]|uniref:GGDEF and EAL domain-containing protein n=1 Tax=Deinococcus sp. KSM4-11 TaxID=2568654 RepID=UPI0010A2E10E|nr:GGDEF and EAL domain-containing protein [Deinococcus sp. KSM4-11]THF87674.1 EAL domain-containing protein [Deinococcus sp. KSM4-11]